MAKRMGNEELQRIKLPYDTFMLALELLLKHPRKKNYRADRTAVFSLSLKDSQLLSNLSNANAQYNTKETRFCKRLAYFALRHLRDLFAEDSWTEEAYAAFGQMCSLLEQHLLHPVLRACSEAQEETMGLALLNEEERNFFLSYENLKYALCELEAEREIGLSEVDWDVRDVLVGSFGSEKQWKHNLAKKYYYAPEQRFDPTCFPIRYVALYQSSHFSEPGIYYYGVVTNVRRKQRKKIWFPTQRKNGEEWYLVFRVKRWQRLSKPIAIQDEGVFAPKFTNLFLLGHAEKSYELFRIRSAKEYRILRQIQRSLANHSHPSDWKVQYPIEGGKSILVHDGLLELLDERGVSMRTCLVSDFSQHPTCYLDDFFECIAREPEEHEAPRWLKQENEAYMERYGTPYSDD